MAGIYQEVLGSAFGRLQEPVQEYFSLEAGSGYFGVGTGTFDVAGCPQAWLRPLLGLASAEEAFFPEYGVNVPFRIENHAHLDPFGRPSLTARREISFPNRTRIFQDTTSLQPTGSDAGSRPARLVDYVGRNHRLVTDLDLEVTSAGVLRGISQRSRLLAGPLRIPLPAALDAKAFAQQDWDEAAGRHRIQVKVLQPQLGTVLVYAGSFDYRLERYQDGPAAAGLPGALPAAAGPRRWQYRD
jgi:Domain of unknown function (DUF4166)